MLVAKVLQVAGVDMTSNDAVLDSVSTFPVSSIQKTYADVDAAVKVQLSAMCETAKKKLAHLKSAGADSAPALDTGASMSLLEIMWGARGADDSLARSFAAPLLTTWSSGATLRAPADFKQLAPTAALKSDAKAFMNVCYMGFLIALGFISTGQAEKEFGRWLAQLALRYHWDTIVIAGCLALNNLFRRLRTVKDKTEPMQEVKTEIQESLPAPDLYSTSNSKQGRSKGKGKGGKGNQNNNNKGKGKGGKGANNQQRVDFLHVLTGSAAPQGTVVCAGATVEERLANMPAAFRGRYDVWRANRNEDGSRVA
jgi:hypothetical protein